MPQVENVAGATARLLQDFIHARPQFAPGPQQSYRIEVALNGAVITNLRPGPIQRHAPIHANHVAAAGSHLGQIRGSSRAEVDDGHARRAQHLQKSSVVRLHIAHVILLAQRQAGPGIENLQRRRACGCLLPQVICLHGDEFGHEPFPGGRLVKHQGFDLGVIFGAAAFYGVAGQGERRARKANQGNAARGQFGGDQFNRCQSGSHRFGGGRGSQNVNVVGAGDGVVDDGTFSLDEFQLQPHADQGGQDVGEDDGGIQVKGINGL